jgi:nuclear transport factor 2 (NTF2) superfamily protein
MMETKQPLPPFNAKTAAKKVRLAEGANIVWYKEYWLRR